LALGGTIKVSQVQLLQPFLSILAAVPLLGESLDWITVGFALAVVATVFVGKRLASASTPLTTNVPNPKPMPEPTSPPPSTTALGATQA
jgi:hypothetical protein